MSEYNIENITSKLKSSLSDKRFQHCKRVSSYAEYLAKYCLYDTEKAKVAGLLHDCAKELSNEELVSLCRNHQLPIWQKDVKEAHYLHGVAGACIAHEKYNIENKDIIFAIANHSGRPDMTLLEKIVMFADVYDSSQRKNINISFVENCKDLDVALLLILAPILQYCVDKGIYMAERTRDAFDYILDNTLKAKYADKNLKFDIDILSDDGTKIINYTNTDLEEEMFKVAIKINKENGLKLKSVGNIRDIGGFKTKNGQTIKKHKILRSANLSKLSKDDADFLKKYGITTIIDLRSSLETVKEPDINIEDFEYYHCPLTVGNQDLDSFRNRLIERKDQSFTTSEDIWYNVQYFVSFNMIDMYKSIFFDKESIKQTKKIFSIIKQSKEGVLLHCTSGKDRTGVIIMLLLNFLNVSYKDMRADYFTSSLYGLAVTESYIIDMLLDGFGRKIIGETKRVLGVSIDSLPAIRNIIEQKYGSVDEYIKNVINIDKNIVRKLNEKLCE